MNNGILYVHTFTLLKSLLIANCLWHQFGIGMFGAGVKLRCVKIHRTIGLISANGSKR